MYDIAEQLWCQRASCDIMGQLCDILEQAVTSQAGSVTSQGGSVTSLTPALPSPPLSLSLCSLCPLQPPAPPAGRGHNCTTGENQHWAGWKLLCWCCFLFCSVCFLGRNWYSLFYFFCPKALYFQSHNNLESYSLYSRKFLTFLGRHLVF